MKYDRILTEKVRTFFTTASSSRDFLLGYLRENADKGAGSVALCFRGAAATLYYRCHQLLRIRSSNRGMVGEFDLRHARFTPNYMQIFRTLRDRLHVEIAGFSDPSFDTRRKYAAVFPDRASATELEEIIPIFRGLIDDFLDPKKCDYAFDVPQTERKKRASLEKDRQQELYAAHFLHEDFFYYDLEFSQREAAKNGVHGRFDLLGLRREGGAYTLLLTELKSTHAALWGRSGIEDHERDYVRYLESPLMETRKREACEAARLLFEIFERPCPEGLTPENIKDVKIRFVFSDSVIDAGRAYRPNDDRIEKAYFSTESNEEIPLL